MKLYTYFRSSASYRVRIALHFKKISFESVYINLRKNDQESADYTTLNPQQRVPTLIDDDGKTLTQSLAIIDYLEQKHPSPALLPKDPYEQAKVRAFALAIAADLHPLNNLGTLTYLSTDMGASQEQKDKWYQHWLKVTFTALEKQISNPNSTFCFGNELTLADVCLIPQIYNALRFHHPMENYPTLKRIYEHCLTIPAFYKASPEEQEDFSL